VIKYLGSKRTLVPLIERVVAQLPVRSACDLFAGTTRVGQALRRQGLQVVSNDSATYSEVLGQAYIAADGADRAAVAAMLASLDELPGRRGYFTETFCEGARYLQPDNGARVDAIRDAIDTLELSAVQRGLLLTALLEAAGAPGPRAVDRRLGL
jgi:adenine-specific DNA-methyltransferase